MMAHARAQASSFARNHFESEDGCFLYFKR